MSLWLYVLLCSCSSAESVPIRQTVLSEGRMYAYEVLLPMPVTGFFVVDSLSMLGRGRDVLPQVLRRLYEVSGHIYAGFCIPGATICPLSPAIHRSLTYADAVYAALDFLGVPSVTCILLISGGNDMYTLAQSGVPLGMLKMYMNWHAKELSNILLSVSSEVGMIVGGSSKAWGYDAFPFLRYYDRLVFFMNMHFAELGFRILTGAAEFSRLHLRDRIGHVHWDSRNLLAHFFCYWMERVLRRAETELASKL